MLSKKNLVNILIILVILSLFLNFEIWKFYPIYNNELFQDWKYISNYNHCLNNEFTKVSINICKNLFKVPFIYPKIWLYISNILENNYYLFIYIPIIISLFIFQLLMKNRNLLYYLFVFSPTTILLFQRGNNEIIIFIILFIFAYLCSSKLKNFSVIPLLISTYLKIYPFVLIFKYLFFLKLNKIVKLISCILLLILIFSMTDEISLISKNLQPFIKLAYSSNSIFHLINFNFNENIEIFYYFKYIFLFAIFFLQIKLKKNIKIENNNIEINLFIVGSIILTASFFFSDSFDYRFIYSAFLFPLIFTNLKKNRYKRISYAILILIFFSLWFEFPILIYSELIDLDKIINQEGYILNTKTFFYVCLILVKNLFYWILNSILLIILINLVRHKINFLFPK